MEMVVMGEQRRGENCVGEGEDGEEEGVRLRRDRE